MSDTEDIRLNKGDVTVEPLDSEPCDNCGADVDAFGALSGAWATKKVMLDLRGNGMNICVGIYCDTCAEEEASRLRASLPDGPTRVILRTNTVPGSMVDRILEERTEDLHKWAAGEDFKAPPSFLAPPQGEPGEADGPGKQLSDDVVGDRFVPFGCGDDGHRDPDNTGQCIRCGAMLDMM